MVKQLTPQQQSAQRRADELGRWLVTMIDGRIAVILPAIPKSHQEEWITLLIEALEAGGIGILVSMETKNEPSDSGPIRRRHRRRIPR